MIRLREGGVEMRRTASRATLALPLAAINDALTIRIQYETT
jgi:hypothetical protein